MNLNSRLSRIEATQVPAKQHAIIVALDEADYQRQFEELLLSRQPGLLTITGTIAGQAFEETTGLLPHEAALELLS